MPRYANRKDNSHKDITALVAKLRDEFGIKIHFRDVHEKKGFFDTQITFGGDMMECVSIEDPNWLMGCIGTVLQVEIKTSRKAKITEAEFKFLQKNRGNYAKVCDFEDLISALNIVCSQHELRELQKMVYYYDVYILGGEFRWKEVMPKNKMDGWELALALYKGKI